VFLDDLEASLIFPGVHCCPARVHIVELAIEECLRVVGNLISLHDGALLAHAAATGDSVGASAAYFVLCDLLSRVVLIRRRIHICLFQAKFCSFDFAFIASSSQVSF